MVNVGQNLQIWRIALFVHDCREQQTDLLCPPPELVKVLRSERKDLNGPLFPEQPVHADLAVELFLIFHQRI